MILTIDKKERDSFEKACKTYGAEARFYTMENNELLIKVEILEDGGPPSVRTAFFIGRDTGMQKLSNAILK